MGVIPNIPTTAQRHQQILIFSNHKFVIARMSLDTNPHKDI
jgi:hypothetical protein